MTSVANPGATDSELLHAHLAGDATAFEQLHQRHHDLVWRTCRRLVPAAEVEDAVQAVFLVLLRQAGRLQQHSCLPAWLVTTADLTCRTAERDRRRRLSGYQPLPVAELSAPAATPADPQMDELFSAMSNALSDLNARQQAVVVRHLMQGEPQATLAQEFGVAVGTIASDLNRALARLRHLLSRRGITVSALGLGLACRAQAEVSVPLPIITSPSPQALALANQVVSTMRQRRLRRHLGWAFALLGCLATGGVAVELAREQDPVKPVADAATDLPASTLLVFRAPDLDRSRARFQRSPYASQGWNWPAPAQQQRQVLEQTQVVELGFCVDKDKQTQGGVLQLRSADAAAAATSWETLLKTNAIYTKLQQTAPLRWEAWQPLSAPAKPANDAPADPKKTKLSMILGGSYPPKVQTAAPGLKGPLDPESDVELLIRLDRGWVLSVYDGAQEPPQAVAEDHDRVGLPRLITVDWQLTPGGIRETFRRIPGAQEAAELAARAGTTIDSAVFAPLGGDTLAAIAVADPGATLLAPWLLGSRAWCDERLKTAGLPALTELMAQLNGTAVLAVRTAAPFPVLDFDLTCTQQFGTTVLDAFSRLGDKVEAAANQERLLTVGPLIVRIAWADGHLRATTDPQGFRAAPADAGAFLRDPAIIAARTRSGDTPARILGLSRSGSFWSTAAQLLSGMGLPLARDIPQRLAAYPGGGYLRYTTTPAAITYDAEGLSGGPFGLLGVIGLIQSNGQVLDPAILLHSLAATLSHPEF